MQGWLWMIGRREEECRWPAGVTLLVKEEEGWQNDL